MKSYIQKILRTAETTRELCENAIEEINDGAERGNIIISLTEAVYAYQKVLEGYMKRYYNYFREGEPEYDRKLHLRLARFCRYSPEEQLKQKLRRRTEMNKLP